MQLQINQPFGQNMENRVRRCNLGLPEGAEGKDLTAFEEQLLITTYGLGGALCHLGGRESSPYAG